jgi:roadblock/LC7 domain-containing protein
METPSTPTPPSEPPPPPSEPPPPPPRSEPAPSAAAPYPVRVEAERQPEYNRFLPLVKWLLAIPHYIVLFFLLIGVFFAKIVAFFAVLITRRYPEGIFNFVSGTLAWAWNVTAYVYLLTDRYPPFALERDPTYPARLEIDYPADGVDRWRPLVHWILIIPFAIIAGVLSYLAAVVAFIGVFVILFTKNLPEGMFKLILIPYRWQFRSGTYALFMVTRYPPFEWEEEGATRPAP